MLSATIITAQAASPAFVLGNPSNWLTSSAPAVPCYNHFVEYTNPGGSIDTATFTFQNVQPGYYQVGLAWNANTNRVAAVPVAVKMGTTTEWTQTVDQQLVPGAGTGTTAVSEVDAGAPADGNTAGASFPFQMLTNGTTNTIIVTSASNISVTLSDNGQSGTTIADAAMLLPLATLSSQVPQPITYGTPSLTLTGTLPPTTSGESVKVSLGGTQQTATIQSNGSFSTTFDTHLLAASATPYAITYTYAGDSNFAGWTNTSGGGLTVNKATPTLNTLAAVGITYGTALANTQLSSDTANVGGSFAYTTAAGMVLNAGNGQPENVTFTPTDTTDYTTATSSVAVNVAKANATINVTPYSVTYNAAAHADTATATGVGSTNLATDLSLSGTSHTNAGSYSDSWTFTDPTGNYNSAAGTVTDVIAQATPTINVTPYSGTYTGVAQTATGTATGVAGANLAADLSLSGTSHTGAGTYSDGWSFTDPSGNYSTAAGTITDVIAKANPTINVTPYSGTYTGVAQTATGTAKGVLGETLAGLSLSGTAHTNAGTYASDSWTFTDSTGNYNNASGTVSDSIAKANATINVTPYTGVTYNAAAQTATGTATGVLGETLAGLSLSGTAHTDAGTYATDSWTFTDVTGNYNSTSGTVSDSIVKATPTVTVAAVSAVTYDGTQHGTTAEVYGVGGADLGPATVSYNTTGGLAPVHAGSYVATGTYAASLDYTSATATTAIVVNQAALTVTAASGQSKIFGTTDPALTYAITSGSLVSGDSLNGALSRATGENPGTYAITQGTLTAGSDYSLTFVPANFTINAAGEATTTAIDAYIGNITYGDNTIFEATVSTTSGDVPTGYVDFTEVDATGKLVQDLGEAPLVGGVADLSGPTLAYNGGNTHLVTAQYLGDVTGTGFASSSSDPTNPAQVFVAQAPLTITASDAEKVFGNTLTFAGTEFTAQGLVGTDSISGVTLASNGAAATAGAGSYAITPSAATAATGTDLSNYAISYANGSLTVDQATPVITWANPSAINYGTALSGTQLDATASVPGSFTYTPASGDVLSAGRSQTLSVTFTPTDGADYTSATQTAQITVNKVTASVSATPVSITYGTGLADSQLSGTASYTVGGNSVTVPGTFTYTAAEEGKVLHASASGQTETVTFTPSDTTDYSTVTSTVTVDVAQATPSVASVNAVSVTYGTALANTQLSGTASVGGTFAYTSAAGTVLGAANGQSEAVTFTPTDSTDYTTANSSVVVNVAQATPSVASVAPVNITYGTALADGQLSGTATFVVGGVSTNVAGTFTYTPAEESTVLGVASGQTENVVFTPSDTTDYTSATSMVTVNVAQAAPSVSVTPVSITYGTSLADTQLAGTAGFTVGGVSTTVAGTYAYTSAEENVVLGAANGQTESVVFTPSDTTDYSVVNTTVAVNVAQATPAVASVTPVSITYGTGLADGQLAGAATYTVGGVSTSVAGTFTYTAAEENTVLGAANGQTETVTFTPTDTTDYTAATSSVVVNVAQATPVVASVTPVDITYGTALADSQISGSATFTVGGVSTSVAGTFTYATAEENTVLGAASGQTETVTFTPTDTTDYTAASSTVTVNVAQATPVVTSVNAVNISYGTALADSQLSGAATFTVNGVSTTVNGTFTYTSAEEGLVLKSGSGQSANVVFTPTDATDYTTANSTVVVNVGLAVPSVSVNPVTITYGTVLANSQLSGTATFTVNGVSTPVAGAYSYTSAAGSLLNASANGQSESVTFTPTDTADYATATGTVVVTVNAATPVVTVTDNNGTYNGSQFTATDTVDGGSTLDGATPALTYYSGSTGTGTPLSGAPTNAGTYTVVANFAATADGNYLAGSASQTFTVAKASLTVGAPSLTSSVYGQGVNLSSLTPSLSSSVPANVLDSDVTSVTFASSGASAKANAGNYFITVASVNGANVSQDYNVSTRSGILSVAKAPLYLSVESGLTKVYGSTFSLASAGIATGLQNGDSVTVTCTSLGTAATAGVGTYTVTPAVTASLSNYTIKTVAAGSLVVTQAPLTLTINSLSKLYGVAYTSANFSGTFSGMQNGDTFAAVYSSAGSQANAAVGTYDVTASVSGAKLANYSVAIVNGTGAGALAVIGSNFTDQTLSNLAQVQPGTYFVNVQGGTADQQSAVAAALSQISSDLSSKFGVAVTLENGDSSQTPIGLNLTTAGALGVSGSILGTDVGQTVNVATDNLGSDSLQTAVENGIANDLALLALLGE